MSRKKDADVIFTSQFVSQGLRLLMISLCLYLLAQLWAAVSHENIITRTEKCKYCRKMISVKVRFSHSTLYRLPLELSRLGQEMWFLHQLAGWTRRQRRWTLKKFFIHSQVALLSPKYSDGSNSSTFYAADCFWITVRLLVLMYVTVTVLVSTSM
jgi:hypothetical protein